MNRETFFYRPTTVRDVTAGRTVLEPDRHTLVDVIDKLDPRQEAILVRDYTIVPTVSEQGIPYTHGQNFLKRGPKVHLAQPRSMEDARQKCLSALISRAYALNNLDPHRFYSGVSWRSLRTRQRKEFHLVDILEGARIFAFAHQSSDTDDKLRIKIYTKTPNLQQQGGTFEVEVPSRSQEGRYSLTLHHVPLSRRDSFHRYSLWRELSGSGHGGGFTANGEKRKRVCSKTYDPVTFRDASRAEVYCPHEVAAFLHISQRVRETTGGVIRQPFPLPTQFIVDRYLTLKNNVLITGKKRSKITQKEYRVFSQLLLRQMIKRN